MKKLALAMAAATALAFTAPAVPGFTSDAQAQTTVKRTTTVRGDGVVRKKVVIKRGDNVRRKVVIRHGDRGLHRGWSHSRHHGAMKTVTVKRTGPHRTVIKKKTVIR